MLAAAVEAARPHQWGKNLLVFAPLLFAQKFRDPESVLAASGAFVVFCLLASGTYLVNDVVDRETDRLHELKRKRPIASGRLPVGVALGVAAALGASGVLLALVVTADPGDPFWPWPLGYVALNLAYTFWLKQLVIVDCLCIAIGFQLRVHAGSVAIGVESSRWILLCTFFFAMFLAFCKRRDELLLTGSAGGTRSTMREYTVPFLDQIIAPLAALSILAYALYTVSPETVAKHGPRIVFTVPFVVFGVFRYLFLVHQRGHGGDPARTLFRDRALVSAGILWLASVLLLCWIGP